MRRLALVLVPLGLVLLAAADDAKKEVEKVQGSWIAARYVVDGKALDEKALQAIKLTVRGDQSTYVNGDIESKGTYQFNPAKDPKELDIGVIDGPDKGKTYLAIYEVDRDELRICLTRTGKERPKKFASEPGSKLDLEIWKRKK